MKERVPFQKGLFKEDQGGRLLGNKCSLCGRVYFPKARLCRECGHDELSEIELSRQGTLYTYTIGRMPASHFKPPCFVGYVDLPEGVRVFAPLEIKDGNPLQVGQSMELVISELWEREDKEIIGYKFKPV
ncbi:MAG: OB-fold domain-containing protein [Syntrophobacteraceae bacterium]